MQHTNEQLAQLPFEERLRHAPYSIFMPTPDYGFWTGFGCGQSTGSGLYIVDSIEYFVSTCHGANGYNESASVAKKKYPLLRWVN